MIQHIVFYVRILIFSEAAELSETWERRGVSDDVERTVPLLMQNKVPEGFETDDNLNVELRPDEVRRALALMLTRGNYRNFIAVSFQPEEADYGEVPIEQYGMAMLRGMGFQPGQGVGKNSK